MICLLDRSLPQRHPNYMVHDNVVKTAVTSVEASVRVQHKVMMSLPMCVAMCRALHEKWQSIATDLRDGIA